MNLFFRIEYIFTCPIYDDQIGHVVLFERFPYVFYDKNWAIKIWEGEILVA
jgi:hypothetical protein